MSASLVGSEMCIRDRPTAIVIADRQGIHPMPAPSATCGAALKVAARLGAVSYTHLTLPTICSV
eukprot:11682880-Alexandrium_andersonii.AAC.1